MASETNSTPVGAAADLGSLKPETLAGWIGLGSAIGVLGVGLFTVLIYLMRMCAGKDIVSDCIVGKSKVHIEVDTNGDGQIVADQKLVLDLNAKTAKVMPRSPRARAHTVVANPLGEDECKRKSEKEEASGCVR